VQTNGTYMEWMGWDSSVGIAARYGPESPAIELGGVERGLRGYFPLPPRPVLGSTQPAIQ
jgi:hypothetical protein